MVECLKLTILGPIILLGPLVHRTGRTRARRFPATRPGTFLWTQGYKARRRALRRRGLPHQVRKHGSARISSTNLWTLVSGATKISISSVSIPTPALAGLWPRLQGFQKESIESFFGRSDTGVSEGRTRRGPSSGSGSRQGSCERPPPFSNKEKGTKGRGCILTHAVCIRSITC